MRFQSTPRFGSTQTATRQMEDVEEADVGASQSQSSVDDAARSDGRDIVSDSIEVDSYADSLASQEVEESSSSGSSRHEMEEESDATIQGDYPSKVKYGEEDLGVSDAKVDHLHEDAGTPPVKRRRLPDSASPARTRMVATHSSDTDVSEDGCKLEQEDEDDDVEDRTRTRPPAQQPTFQAAPRFKPAPEDELLAQDQRGGTGLHAAPFSPPRRGARYVPGGLASQLQGLLSEVKGWEAVGGDDPAAIVRLLVEEARLGTRMHLVKGRVLTRGSAKSESESEVQNYILAGGSSVRMVKEGSVLRIMPAPAWDVHLGEEWTVACDWSVESLEG
ncbi:hypothetical protein IF1G_07709 [Cordyceps javanica]|uniref:Uncharacterized protein n=1 Tax=Cordyceps javanica TaxID=43265 RepID=A0A545UWZ0_9HYPO|nr:hypothetical protein IF1G_07709 [Cordyceps javanica]